MGKRVQRKRISAALAAFAACALFLCCAFSPARLAAGVWIEGENFSRMPVAAAQRALREKLAAELNGRTFTIRVGGRAYVIRPPELCYRSDVAAVLRRARERGGRYAIRRTLSVHRLEERIRGICADVYAPSAPARALFYPDREEPFAFVPEREGRYVDGAALLETVRAALAATQRYSSTFNQSGSGISEEFVTELSHRGITFWPWTYNTQQTFLDQYFWGINGFTTDYALWVRNTAKSVKFQSDIDSIGAGQSVQLDFSAFTYADKETPLGEKAEIVIIDGGDNVTLEGNTMTATGEGSVSFYCRYKTSLSNRSLYVCSDIVTLTTGGAGSVDNSTDVSDNSKTPVTSDNNVVVWVVVGVVAVVAIAGVVYAAAKKKKS